MGQKANKVCNSSSIGSFIRTFVVLSFSELSCIGGDVGSKIWSIWFFSVSSSYVEWSTSRTLDILGSELLLGCT